MKRVICLYRVSTVGQVDHDDIPMQKKACREYVAQHPDWEIVDEISEKGVSGYKVSTNARDAIVEIKKRAITHQFDVLLVFMFDRLGRRDDETPFVVQWFVQQGIEVWSTREGEQRFDNHVDKLLNYIRYWQASGESEKTSIRVRTKHSQMVQDGEWRGGYIPYGYRLEYLGRTNKKNMAVRDLVIDENEAEVIRTIYRLLMEEGYGTNRVAQYLNDKGILTKKGTTLWRGTTIRAIIENPIYKGIRRFGDERSEVFEDLRIVDDVTFEKCIQLVKGRACTPAHAPDGVVHTDSRSLLSGLLYCADCGTRLYFSHNVTTKKMADGTKRKYERDMYRCYRKLSSRKTCRGPSAYNAERLNDAVDTEIRKHLARLGSISEEDLLKAACSQNADLYEVAYRQAEEEFQKASRQVAALEEETVKALTGESQLDLSVVNGMLLKHRAKLEECQRAMEEAKAKKEAEAENNKAAQAQVKEMLTWVERYDKASVEAKHMIIAALVDRIEIGENYEVHIQFKVSAEQFIRQTA